MRCPCDTHYCLPYGSGAPACRLCRRPGPIVPPRAPLPLWRRVLRYLGLRHG